MENLKEKTARGLMWGAVNNGTMQVLNLLIGIVILRQLSPEDTGLVGMLAIFTAIAGNLQSSGFSTALINEREPTAEQYNSVFWFNTLMSLVLYVLLFFSAPLIAWFFHQPRLTSLSRFLFLAFFISSMGITTHAYMVKNMMNREITIVNLTALVVSGATAIIMALSGLAYWSLAWQQVVGAAVLVVGRFYYVSWRPNLSTLSTLSSFLSPLSSKDSPLSSKDSPLSPFAYIRQTFSFSMKILVTMIVNTVNQNMLTVIFGRLFRDARVVGNFFQAYKWDQMAFQTVSGMLQQVAQPVLVSVRDEQQRELLVFRKMVRFTSLLAFPALLGLALVAREFILCTIGPKWADCVPLLQLLCLSGAFMPLYTLYQNLVISHGRSDVNMWLNIGQIVLQLLVILLFYRQGITLMVAAYTLFNIIWLAAWQPFARRIIGLGWTSLLSDTLPFLLIAAAVMATTYGVTTGLVALWHGADAVSALSHGAAPRTTVGLWALLAVRVVLAAALYYAVLRLLRVAILQECLQFIKHKQPTL